MEEWRAVVGFEGCYEVSNVGRVRSLERRCASKHPGHTRRVPPKILRQMRHPAGYPQLVLHKDGVPSTVLVHTLVLTAFVGPCPDGMEACHGPAGVDDNSLGNLRWDTHRENMQDKIRTGSVARGARHGMARLCLEQVVAIRSSNRPAKEIAKEVGVSVQNIRMIRRGETWRIGPYGRN